MSNQWERRDGEISPKPYDFVPFPQAVVRGDTVGHEQVRGDDFLSGVLVMEWQALSPIAVSSGTYLLGEDLGSNQVGIILGLYRVGNLPTIPGSSLKGVVRSIVEAATASCITATRVERRLLPIPDSGARNSCMPEHACPACSLFGRMNRMSKVRFGDAQPPKPIRTMGLRVKPLHQPHANDAPQVYRLDDGRGQFRGRKFYRHGKPAVSQTDAPIEALPEGTRIQSKVWFTNLTPLEMGALCFGLGLDKSITPKLGGNKPRCFGSMSSHALTLNVQNRNGFKSNSPDATLFEGAELDKWIADQVRLAMQAEFLQSPQVEALRQILNFQTAGECPPEMY